MSKLFLAIGILSFLLLKQTLAQGYIVVNVGGNVLPMRFQKTHLLDTIYRLKSAIYRRFEVNNLDNGPATPYHLVIRLDGEPQHNDVQIAEGVKYSAQVLENQFAVDVVFSGPLLKEGRYKPLTVFISGNEYNLLALKRAVCHFLNQDPDSRGLLKQKYGDDGLTADQLLILTYGRERRERDLIQPSNKYIAQALVNKFVVEVDVVKQSYIVAAPGDQTIIVKVDKNGGRNTVLHLKREVGEVLKKKYDGKDLTAYRLVIFVKGDPRIIQQDDALVSGKSKYGVYLIPEKKIKIEK